MTDGDHADRSFGEEGGRLSYGSYLQLGRLLSAQVPESSPPAHDELLFIVTHQAYELWFKQLLHELTAAREAMVRGDAWTARHLFTRVHTIQRLLVEQIGVLETMTPLDFLAFREKLAPASGFQSVQFRELEFLAGLKEPVYLERLRAASTEERERLVRRLDEPSLWDGLLTLLASRGLDVSPDGLASSLLDVARDRTRYAEVWDVCEGLLVFDELAALWRARHVTMVERQIGGKTGTGGSTGASYLRSRLDVRYYPPLWELRSGL